MNASDIANLPVVRHPYEDLSFATYPGDWAVADMVCSPEYAYQTRKRLYQAASRGGCCVEVGAHIGTSTLEAALHFKSVRAFEPSSMNRAILNHNITKNACKHNLRHMYTFPIALSDYCGTSQFWICEDGRAVCHSLNQGVARTGRYEDVEVSTLDALLSEIRDCTMLMIDAEGHDMRVLQGARKFIKNQKTPPVIQLEFAPQFWSQCGSRSDDLIAWASDMNYRMFGNFGNNFSPVSPTMLREMFSCWKDVSQGWIDVYLVEPYQAVDVFPNR